MTELPDLKQLTDEAKDALIVALWEELQKLRQKKPKKTSKNSSLPPAKGFKTEVKGDDKEAQGKREASVRRERGGRPLSENPDQTIKATVKSCQSCGTEIEESLQNLLQRYDKIDVPPIQPIVSRVELYGCCCPKCGQPQIASVPVGMEPGSPFGNRIAALVTTLRYSHAISYGRMKQLLGEVTPTQEDGIRLQNRYRALQDNLFLFLDDPTIPATNNTSEQALRWSVIFRKVTNGFRSDWGRDLFANVRSVVNTGKRQGLSAFESILAALNPLGSLFSLG